MSSARRFSALLGLLACVSFVSAQQSLYIPGFDPQPIAVQNLGVGADGATTWLLQTGVPSGTLDESGFEAQATLIEGPTSANLNWIDPTSGIALQENCAIANGLAVCEDNAIYISVTTIATTVTETASPFPVQLIGGGSSATAAPTSSGAGTGGQSSAGQSQSAATTTAPAGSNTGGGAGTLSAPSGVSTVVRGSGVSTAASGANSGLSSANGAAGGAQAVPLVALAAAGLAILLA